MSHFFPSLIWNGWLNSFVFVLNTASTVAIRTAHGNHRVPTAVTPGRGPEARGSCPLWRAGRAVATRRVRRPANIPSPRRFTLRPSHPSAAYSPPWGPARRPAPPEAATQTSRWAAPGSSRAGCSRPPGPRTATAERETMGAAGGSAPDPAAPPARCSGSRPPPSQCAPRRRRV